MAKSKNFINWSESYFKHIDIIVSSGEIRKMFFQRCKDLKIDPYTVALKAGIKPKVFKDNYVNNHEPVCTKSFNQLSFIKALEILGIEIKVLVKTKPFSETYVELVKKGLIKQK